jgi:guanylate kinase
MTQEEISLSSSPQIVCIVGESGSGKSLIAEGVGEFGFSELYSYTTRSPRPNEFTKTFVDQAAFDAIRNDLAAYTKFDGHEYGATHQQIKENHVYVIDPAGVDMLADSIGRENFKVIYLSVDEDVRFDRIKTERGRKQAIQRTEHDIEAFADFHLTRDYDVALTNNTTFELSDNMSVILTLLARWFPEHKE